MNAKKHNARVSGAGEQGQKRRYTELHGEASQEAGMICSPVSLGWIPPSRFKGMIGLDSMISSR